MLDCCAPYRYRMEGVPVYADAPYLLDLHGSRTQIGYDYAALLHDETSATLDAFLNTMVPAKADQVTLFRFIDWLWEHFYKGVVPDAFLEELVGMRSYYATHPPANGTTQADVVSTRFFALSNMPADTPNIISALEQGLEVGWPQWLKTDVNNIIRILEGWIHGCDAFGVWGTRTAGAQLFSSRNLDYNRDTGIDQYKLVR
jgi:hypothetical protein